MEHATLPHAQSWTSSAINSRRTARVPSSPSAINNRPSYKTVAAMANWVALQHGFCHWVETKCGELSWDERCVRWQVSGCLTWTVVVSRWVRLPTNTSPSSSTRLSWWRCSMRSTHARSTVNATSSTDSDATSSSSASGLARSLHRSHTHTHTHTHTHIHIHSLPYLLRNWLH